MPLIGFDNSYTRLPERFYAPAAAASASEPFMFAFNEPLARELASMSRCSTARAALFSGNLKPDDAANVALAYAATSSVISCRSWVMAAPCCSAK